jgi:hypothetical protein
MFVSWVFCVSCRYRPLRRADHSFIGVQPSVCLIECDLETSTLRRPRAELGCCLTKQGGGVYLAIRSSVVGQLFLQDATKCVYLYSVT